MRQKVYFDENKIALGTSDDYFGEYFISEWLTLPDGVIIEGKSYSLLLALSDNYEQALRNY